MATFGIFWQVLVTFGNSLQLGSISAPFQLLPFVTLQHLHFKTCAISNMCNCHTSNLQHVKFATPAICNTCNLQQVQFATRAICNTFNLQHMQFAICAICNTLTLQHVQFATCAICNTCNLQHVQDKSARWISYIDQLDKSAERTSWTDQLESCEIS